MALPERRKPPSKLQEAQGKSTSKTQGNKQQRQTSRAGSGNPPEGKKGNRLPITTQIGPGTNGSESEGEGEGTMAVAAAAKAEYWRAQHKHGTIGALPTTSHLTRKQQ